MFERLGIVTNIWAKRMENGDQFQELAVQFGQDGFQHLEVRDGDYLRNSEFGNLVQEIEAAIPLQYWTSVQTWRRISGPSEVR